ncbi:hypothetical protein DPMN_185903 [Dreissena polymorpha]|uniref:Uncharacterized protein n=1 Tax=Dreissena polymorpha TaxID=45954 RepID=A0A9D4DMS7_DREPO|nr:hypothetical protein DPMN_185903 [Dreissena polymorpha]
MPSSARRTKTAPVTARVPVGIFRWPTSVCAYRRSRPRRKMRPVAEVRVKEITMANPVSSGFPPILVCLSTVCLITTHLKLTRTPRKQRVLDLIAPIKRIRQPT